MLRHLLARRARRLHQRIAPNCAELREEFAVDRRTGLARDDAGRVEQEDVLVDADPREAARHARPVLRLVFRRPTSRLISADLPTFG